MTYLHAPFLVYSNMAQVRKLQGGNTIDQVKLFKHEGLGDYNVDDLVSLYARSINDNLNSLDLKDKDRQGVLDYAGRIIQGIKNGTITGRDASGNFITSDKSLASTGINEKKFLGIGGYKKDDDFYKNSAYYLINRIFEGASPYIAPTAKKAEEAKDYKLNFAKTLSDYYYNGQDIDPNTWDYANAKSNILARLNDEKTKVESGDYKNKADVIARIDDTIAAINADNLESNVSVGNRLGLNLRNFLFKPTNPEEAAKAAQEKEAKEAEQKAKEAAVQPLRDQARAAAESGNRTTDLSEIQTYFNPETRTTTTGIMRNGVFIPQSGRPFALDKNITWDSKAPNYFSPYNLAALSELVRHKSYSDKIPNFYESIKGLKDQSKLPDTVKSWFTSYESSNPEIQKKKEEEEKNTMYIRQNDFPGFNSYESLNRSPKDFLTILKRGFGVAPGMPIEKGSMQDNRLELTEKVGEWFNDFSDSIFQLDGKAGTYKNKKVKYVEKKEKGGVTKFQNPAGRIQAKDMSKWNRNNVLSSYNWGADLDSYKGDLAGYIAAFNGGEDIYDRMVGDTDYFAGKNVKYNVSNPLAGYRQRTILNTNPGFDKAIRQGIVGYGVTEGTNSFDNLLGDRTYNRTLGWITPEQAAFFNQNHLNSRGLELYDKGNGRYRLRPLSGNANGDIATTVELPETVVTPTSGTNSTAAESYKGRYTNPAGKKKQLNIQADDLIGTGRLLGTIMTNNRIASGLKNSLSPLLLDPLQIRRQVTGDLVTRNYLERQAAEANRLGSRPITSSGDLALGQMLDFNNQANDLRLKGYSADKQAIDRTTAEARQASEQNAAARMDASNRNRASMLGIKQAKANIEAQRKSANWQQAIAPWLMDKEMKIAQNRKINNELDYQEEAYLAGSNLDEATKNASLALEAQKQRYISNGGNENDWFTSQEYKNAQAAYDKKRTEAANNYRKALLESRRRMTSYKPFVLFEKGGKMSYAEKSLLQRSKDFNKSLLEDNKLFHKIIMDSKKENNKLIMSLSSLTKDLIIKSMTL